MCEVSTWLQAPLRSPFNPYRPSRLFLSRGADIDIMNREGDTPLTLARPDSPVWVALQINRKLRRGVSNRLHRTERIICRWVRKGAELQLCFVSVCK